MDRFWSKVKKGEPHECWEWQAFRFVNGYGQFWHQGRDGKAHRMAYTMAKGPIPEGLVVMHTCDNRACCNPDHLRLGTQGDNLQDMYDKDRRGKLTVEDRKTIRHLYHAEQQPVDALARFFHVTPTAIRYHLRYPAHV